MAGPSGPAYMRKDGYFMKAMKRRLLSLLLAMAMVCTLVPSALAAADLSVAVNATPSSTEITAGTPITFTATLGALSGTGSENYDAVNPTWSITPNTGATINSSTGAVSITAAGTYTIKAEGTANKKSTVTDGAVANTKGYEGTAQVTITEAQQQTPVVNSVVITPTTAVELTLGNTTTATAQLGATVNVSNGASQNVTWDSSDKTVATVSATGLVTGLKAGTTEITATSVDKGSDGSPIVARKSITVKNPAATATGTITTNATTFQANGSVTFLLTVNSGAENVKDVVWSSSDSSSVTFQTNNGTLTSGSTTVVANLLKAGNVTITATMRDSSSNPIGTATKAITISSPLTITPNQQTLTYYGQSVTLTAYYGNTIATNVSWSIEDAQASNPYNNGYVTLSPLATAGSATVTAVATTSRTTPTYIRATYVVGNETFIARCPIYTSYSGASFATATVYSDNGGYALGDLDDAGKSSIVDQLDSYFYSTTNGRYGVAYVRFTSTTSGNYGSLNASTNYDYYVDRYTAGTSNRSLRDVVFYPGTAKGPASFPVTVYYYTANGTSSNTSSVSGTITLNVTEGTSSGDITYTASIGDDVYFDMGDFEDFYYSKTSRGTLDRVTFTMPSGGYLYSDRNRLSSSNATCYVSPRSTENDLGSVYFSPTGTTASRAGTVRVGFTAYGNRSNVSGTVAITYLNGAAKDITYSTVGGSVTLDHQDFIDAYKEVTGKTAPSNLTIQFQEVPSNGTLTYTGGSKDVDLTKSNVRSNKYSTKTTGSYRLNQLTYTGTRGTDTIEYIAYSGSAAQFTGKVVFNGSTGGQAVMFSQNDFVRANSVMSNAVKVRFVTPTNGTLTMNGANAAGIDIASSLLGSVSYKPKAGFNGTDKIIFAAYDSRNQLAASGSVNITVVGNTGTGTTTPGGVTDVSQFKDVSSTAWYRNDLATLVSQGIITGKGEGKFDPLGTVTYGEALKMILEACGYTATLGTGSNWAINYKNLAVSNGWISSSIDLNAAISRNATAELAARVMGVAPATGGSPFADEANAYAVALYYTNPQIFVGDNTTGKLLFKNGSPLLRQEVCAVICRVRNYHTQHTTNTMPDGI